MNDFQKIIPAELTESPFTLLNEDWALLTAGDSSGDCNTMTVSWGGVGILWHKPVATVYIRPQRHTLSFAERSEHFTLSFFAPGSYREALGFCGSKSGRDYNKFRECGITPIELDGGVGIAEARLILACKKLYWNDIDPANFLDPTIDSKNYPHQDYHRMFIGEITGIYRK